MDTSQDVEPDVVRWVASQSPIPALQALIKEAESEKNSRPSSSLPPPAPSRRPNPLANSVPSTAKTIYVPQEEEPEAIAFVELLKDAFKKLDENSLKKQRLAARAREKQRELSLASSRIDSRARPLTKTSSASAICPSTRALLSTSTPAFNPNPRGRALAKTASLGPSVHILSGKSTPASLPNHTLNCDPKPASAPPLLARASTAHPTTTPKANTQQDDGDSPMHDVIDLTETDTEWERSIPPPTSRADTTMYMHLDDDDSDTGMDMSFFRAEPSHVPACKSKPQPNTASRPLAPTQRSRTAPPPLGMRRVPQLQPSQYGLSQGKGVSVPRFKPPLLTNPGRTGGGATKPATTTSWRPRGGATKVAVAPKVAQANQDADSSFDVSFDMDVDALEEAMKAYD